VPTLTLGRGVRSALLLSAVRGLISSRRSGSESGAYDNEEPGGSPELGAPNWKVDRLRYRSPDEPCKFECIRAVGGVSTKMGGECPCREELESGGFSEARSRIVGTDERRASDILELNKGSCRGPPNVLVDAL
jgi:hypothetical protein